MRRESFEECIGKGHLLETGDRDTFLAEELLTLAEHRELFWKIVMPHANEYPSLFLEGYYEIVKGLCTAILALDGWKAANHECLFAYLKEKRRELEVDMDYLLGFKDLRNEIDYRGVQVSPELWKKNKLKVEVVIRALKEYVKSRL